MVSDCILPITSVDEAFPRLGESLLSAGFDGSSWSPCEWQIDCQEDLLPEIE